MNKIILFDGDCNFCNGSVRFIMRRDPTFNYMFASLQSEKGRHIMKKYGIPETMDSFVYIDRHKWYAKSSAALHVCKNLSGFWKLLYSLIIVPKPIRDYVYNLIAKNRYAWFGKQRSCHLISPEDQKRFL